MSFVRPEALSWLRRFRAPLISGAAVLLGLYWAVFSFGLLVWIGWAVAALGLVLGFSFIQRLQFGADGKGTGVVEVDEGQIAYFAPETGGIISVREMAALSYDARHVPALWRLRQPGAAELVIPENARGAEALFDAFSVLPGLTAERLLAGQRGANGHRRLIWRRDMQLKIDTEATRLHS